MSCSCGSSTPTTSPPFNSVPTTSPASPSRALAQGCGPRVCSSRAPGKRYDWKRGRDRGRWATRGGWRCWSWRGKPPWWGSGKDAREEEDVIWMRWMIMRHRCRPWGGSGYRREEYVGSTPIRRRRCWSRKGISRTHPPCHRPSIAVVRSRADDASHPKGRAISFDDGRKTTRFKYSYVYMCV